MAWCTSLGTTSVPELPVSPGGSIALFQPASPQLHTPTVRCSQVAPAAFTHTCPTALAFGNNCIVVVRLVAANQQASLVCAQIVIVARIKAQTSQIPVQIGVLCKLCLVSCKDQAGTSLQCAGSVCRELYVMPSPLFNLEVLYSTWSFRPHIALHIVQCNVHFVDPCFAAE